MRKFSCSTCAIFIFVLQMEIQIFKLHFIQATKNSTNTDIISSFQIWIRREFCCYLQYWCGDIPLIISALWSHSMRWLFTEFWCCVKKKSTPALLTYCQNWHEIYANRNQYYSIEQFEMSIDCWGRCIQEQKMPIIQSTQRGFSILSEPKHRVLHNFLQEHWEL